MGTEQINVRTQVEVMLNSVPGHDLKVREKLFGTREGKLLADDIEDIAHQWLKEATSAATEGDRMRIVAGLIPRLQSVRSRVMSLVGSATSYPEAYEAPLDDALKSFRCWLLRRAEEYAAP